jgi:enolase
VVSIKRLSARQVLDSRGNPTVEATVYAGDYAGSAIVPSGASVGIYESLELRDKGKAFAGKGVQKAVSNVSKISTRLKGMDITKQKELDAAMLKLDGTKNKSKLGANAILAASLACARTAAISRDMPLYEHLNSISGRRRMCLPVPFANIINGGKHAGTALRMQEFMVAPIKAKSLSLAVQSVCETYQILKVRIEEKYGKTSTNVGDEGGFAPPLKRPEEALDLIEWSIKEAGYSGILKIAMDPAASEFHDKGMYKLHKAYTPGHMIEYYKSLAKSYPIISIEDPFEQNDFDSFQAFTKVAKHQVVGDDLLVTNVDRIKIALKKKLCNALLLKVNQIGSLSESIESAILALNNGWKVMVSHRSGETEDPFISDLAVGLGTGQIKLGAPCRGERTAKYNQLLRIEEDSGLKYARW